MSLAFLIPCATLTLSKSGIGELPDENKQKALGKYAVMVHTPLSPLLFGGMKFLIYVPTVCLGPDGLRLFATQYIITDKKNKKGDYIVEDPVGYQSFGKTKWTPRKYLEKGFKEFGYDYNDCRTVRLIRGN